MTPWVVAVRAAMPSPRPQGWQALQQAVGLAGAGVARVTLVADAALPDGVPRGVDDWLGRPLPPEVSIEVPQRRSRPPGAGVRFRAALRRHRSPRTVLWCRDPRVAAREAGRWARVIHEWHVSPDPHDRRHRAALRGADLHVTPAPGIAEDLRARGLPRARVALLPNACGLDRSRALARLDRPGRGVIALGLHRRSGLDTALAAWTGDPGLPPLRIGGRDQGGARVDAWRRGSRDPRVTFVGPAWGAARESLLDDARVWLTAYPSDETTRTRLCPLQVADALGSGLRVVAPDLPSVRALAGAAGGLHLYRADDPGALAAAVMDAHAAPPPSLPSRPSWVDRGRALREMVA